MGGEVATEENLGTGEAAPRAGRGHQVAVHTRTGGLHSIRLRLMLPIVLAAIGLVGLGAAQTDTAVHSALAAKRGEAVANTAIVALQVENELEQEIAEADRLRARGGAGAALLTAAQGQTDLAVTKFRQVSAQAREIAPNLAGVLNSAAGQLGTLEAVRAEVQKLGEDALSGNLYDDIRHAVLAVADALPTALADADLAATARAVAAIARAEYYGAQQRDLLHQVFLRGRFLPGEQAQLAELVGAQDERLAEFSRNATRQQQALYNREFSGPDVTSASAMRSAVLAPSPTPAALKADPDGWYITQSNLMREMHNVQLSLSHTLDQTSRERQAAAANQAMITGAATTALIGIAFGAALFFAVRTSRRLRRLRRAALTVAGVELPGTITSLTTAPDTSAVRGVLNTSAARADSLSVAGSDEIGEVGAALSTVHRQALRLAADQALMRLDIAGLFVALSRRGQTLVNRQLELIADFERMETDPDALGRLFQLDHLAARMRRNDENLLVLAGGEPGGRVMTAVPLIDVIRAASAEIEDYHRIEPVAVAEVAVAAPVVRDLIHLLAELLENATQYSPPSTRVGVSARRTVDTVTVTVFDEGIGIPAAQVTELNGRLSRTTMLTAELAGTMGLLVVSRLAARHQIAVELRSAGGGGTAALVALPIAILAPVPPPLARGEQPAGAHPAPYAVRAAQNSAGRAVTRAVGGFAPIVADPIPPLTRGPAAVAPASYAATGATPVSPIQYGAYPPEVPPPNGTGRANNGATGGPVNGTPNGAGGYPSAGGFSSAGGYPGAGGYPAAGAAGGYPAAGAAGGVDESMGLPRRRPGRLLVPGQLTDRTPPAPADDPSRPPDPDAIRARLSGLASGLAAAARHTDNPRPPA
ncbi:sensor histidine kinase [Rugosimonospora africana]|uniref:sensor histidine kinase n=1 Tax=Rugosimonospora africana TaxID=556532 RepID=UPI00194174F9|nr:ATP-binding protein [Rugosimonospora africana]